MSKLETISEATCIIAFLMGVAICIVTKHDELAGLGFIILAGLLRIAFGYENTKLADLMRKSEELKKMARND